MKTSVHIHIVYRLEMYEKQMGVWEKIKSSAKEPSEVTSSSVIGLLVKDPRLALPRKKSFKQVSQENERIDSRNARTTIQGNII